MARALSQNKDCRTKQAKKDWSYCADTQKSITGSIGGNDFVGESGNSEPENEGKGP